MLRLLFILPLFIFSSHKTVPLKVQYTIDDKSELYLLGSTNVNSFKCSCNDEFAPAFIEADINTATKLIHFKNAGLRLKTTLLNCKNNLMNRDMHKALKADQYPFITLQLLSALPLHTATEMLQGKVYSYEVQTNISIAGISKPQLIHVKFLRSGEHLYRLTASKDIRMSEYNIKPRTPFNIIKIDDVITIHFQLLVTAVKKS